MYNQYVIRGDRNGLGTAGLVLGIVALVLSVIPVLGVLAWFVWPVGLPLACAGLGRCNRHIATNRPHAVAGITLSAVAGAVCFFWVALIFMAPIT